MPPGTLGQHSYAGGPRTAQRPAATPSHARSAPPFGVSAVLATVAGAALHADGAAADAPGADSEAAGAAGAADAGVSASASAGCVLVPRMCLCLHPCTCVVSEILRAFWCK